MLPCFHSKLCLEIRRSNLQNLRENILHQRRNMLQAGQNQRYLLQRAGQQWGAVHGVQLRVLPEQLQLLREEILGLM